MLLNDAGVKRGQAVRYIAGFLKKGRSDWESVLIKVVCGFLLNK